MRDTNKIGWKAVSKTGAVAAGGAGAVAAGIEILESGGNAADAAREQFSRLTSQTILPALSAVRCRFLFLMRKNGR